MTSVLGCCFCRVVMKPKLCSAQIFREGDFCNRENRKILKKTPKNEVHGSEGLAMANYPRRRKANRICDHGTSRCLMILFL